MKFNYDHKPNRGRLSPVTAALMDKAFYSRRSKGLNVQFINAGTNELDEWSFVDAGQRDRFIDRLKKARLDYASSPVSGV